MLHSQARRRAQRFQAASHMLAGLTLVYLALSEEQGGRMLPWMAGLAAVLLLGLVGWEQLQPGAPPPSAEKAAELLGIAVLVAELLQKLPQGGRFQSLAYILSAALLGLSLVLHRRAHLAGKG